jgi:LuxR family maltose regulon positive regulatory protein
MQQHSLLHTKLYIPPIRPELVSRPRLIERLNGGLSRKLTLISAPAGFGKTTLVTQWLKRAQCPSTWLSLDESDNDPTRFLVYFVAALQAIEPRQESANTIGQGALSALRSPQPPPIEAVLTPLINEIATIPDRIILVLDDYHLIDAQSIHEALSFFLENQPPRFHLVIATRDDPHLPLSRLRARDQLTELRVTDLRFTPSEAAEFLNQVMGLKLSAEEANSLETRTEGWIAGLQLAALSMRGREDIPGLIRTFAGDNRYIVDYLVEEVLQRQPERVRSFLLQTAILERLTGSLCDAVTGQENGRGMLEALERGNLFVVPLDDQRRWYRYHHLFADVLRAHLMEAESERVPTLHRRASEWYEQNGLPFDAVRHALAAEDFERVASLAELAWQAMDESFQSAAWLGWVKALPDELIRTRPVLSTQYAEALWMGGELEASEARLRDAERWLEPTRDMSTRTESSANGTCPEILPEPGEGQSRKMIVVDEEQFRTLPARIAIVRAYNAQARGDVSATVKYAELALKLTPEEDHVGRAQATVALGFTYWASGDLEAAHRAIADWTNSMQKAGNIVFAVVSTFGLADIMVAQGRLNEAVRAYKQSLQLASAHDEHVQRVTAHLHLGLAMLYHEMDNQEAFTQHLQKSRELGEQSTLIDWPYRWCLAQAQLQEAGGDLEAALDLLDEAKRLYVRSLVPDIRPIEALKARVYVKQGRLTEALGWARERGLSVDDDLSYLREFEHIVLARVFIVQYKVNRAERSVLQAIGLLERLLKAAEQGRRMGSVIEILVLQALAHQAQGNTPLALAPLERALTLAEPEGYFHIFVDEGPPMAALLREAAKHGIVPNYVSQLRVAFGQDGGKRPVTQLLIEPLSKRELEVLGLLGTELNGPEIARELAVSLSTIRTHTQNIYSKLGVNNRRAAVRRAKELDLL